MALPAEKDNPMQKAVWLIEERILRPILSKSVTIAVPHHPAQHS